MCICVRKGLGNVLCDLTTTCEVPNRSLQSISRRLVSSNQETWLGVLTGNPRAETTPAELSNAPPCERDGPICDKLT